jgi:hypothetical protein
VSVGQSWRFLSLTRATVGDCKPTRGRGGMVDTRDLSEAAIRGTMATLYHALGTSRILVGLVARRGLVEPREEVGLRMFDAEKH